MRRVDLAQSVLLTASGITRLLDGLERAGWVCRDSCSNDARVSYAVLTEDATEGVHVGTGIVGGVECDHLAFRNPRVDWQLWVQKGEQPLPLKYVITTKWVTGAPQYTLRIRDWRTDVETKADAFAFNPPPGASKVAISALSDIDEVPHGVVPTARR